MSKLIIYLMNLYKYVSIPSIYSIIRAQHIRMCDSLYVLSEHIGYCAGNIMLLRQRIQCVLHTNTKAFSTSI